MTRRLAPAATLAAAITLSLFWIMTVLIHVEEVEITLEPLTIVELVEVEREREVPPPPPAELERPKLPRTPTPVTPIDVTPGVKIPFGPTADPQESTLGHSLGPIGRGSANGDAIPLVRVPPRYPERALARGLEGRVLVEFDVDRSGAVAHAAVVLAEPPNVFDRAALEAVRQWRYNPRIENGRAVPRRGLRIAIPFRVAGE